MPTYAELEALRAEQGDISTQSSEPVKAPTVGDLEALRAEQEGLARATSAALEDPKTAAKLKKQKEPRAWKAYEPPAPAESSLEAFGRSAKQGAMNIGGGLVRGFATLADSLGAEGAQDFLDELEISINMEQAKTKAITKDYPVASFIGEVGGEAAAMPLGGAAGGLAKKIFIDTMTGAGIGGLSEAGKGGDAGDIMTSAVFSGALSPVGTLGGEFLERRSAQKAQDLMQSPAEIQRPQMAAQNVEEAQAMMSEVPINLLPAQQTRDPFQIETMSFVGQNPEGSAKAMEILMKQNQEAGMAVDELISMLGVPESAGYASSKAREGAKAIIDKAELKRQQKTSPLYKGAFTSGEGVDVSFVGNEALEELNVMFDSSSPIFKTIDKYLKKIENASGDLGRLQGVNLEIGDELDRFGEGSLGKHGKRFLTMVKKDLVGAMEQNPLYKEAQDEFKRLSPTVDDLRNSVIGRIANISDEQLKTTSKKIFDASENNPAVMKATIKSFQGIDGGDRILKDLLRLNLEDRLGSMRSQLTDIAESGGKGLENAPANLRNALFGNAKQQKVLFSALSEMDKDAARYARWLQKSLDRAATGRPAGSQTGIRNVLSDKWRGVGNTLIRFFYNPIEGVGNIASDVGYSSKVEAIADVLYNPDWKPDMDRILKLNKNTEKQSSEFMKLLNKAEMMNRGILKTRAIPAAERAQEDE